MQAMKLVIEWRGLAADCGDCGLVDSGRTSVKGPRFGGCSTQTLYGRRKSEEGRVLDLSLVQALCPSGPWVRVVKETCWVEACKAIIDFVEHFQADLLSSMFQTCPFQVFKNRCYTAW